MNECVHLSIPQPTPTAREPIPYHDGTDRRLIGRHEGLLGHAEEVGAEDDPLPILEVECQTRVPAPVTGALTPQVASVQDRIVDDFIWAP